MLRVVEKICKDCGCVFWSKSHNAKWCPECRKKYHFTKKERKSPIVGKSLSEVLADLKEFNFKHGTRLSYGQYVSLTEMGVK